MTDGEDMTAQLLRLAGAPPSPSAERTSRVRAAVHREWRADRRRRIVRRGAAAGIALLGVAASLAIVVWMNHPRSIAPPGDQLLAVGERVQGQPHLMRRRDGRDGLQPLSTSTSIYPGDVIETDNASRAALRTADGSSIRLDRGSRVRFVGPSVIEAIGGAAYVVTADGSHGFEVRTALGIVRDRGTQFEVRVAGTSLRLRVRTGTVEIHRVASITAAAAGTEATVTANGVAVRQVAPYGSEWAWTAEVAPSFAIEGQPLRAFLEHLAREQGWTLQYANTRVADAAGRIVLHGSVEGLKAEEALRVVLATSGLQYRLAAGEVLISRPEDAR